MSQSFIDKLETDISTDLKQHEQDIHDHTEKFDTRTEHSFAWLQVLAACLGTFAHGSNDVANAVAPFAAIYTLYNEPDRAVTSKVDVPLWILALGGVGLMIGCLTYGFNIIRALGARLVSMSCSRGYCIELTSALTIILASHYGMGSCLCGECL